MFGDECEGGNTRRGFEAFNFADEIVGDLFARALKVHPLQGFGGVRVGSEGVLEEGFASAMGCELRGGAEGLLKQEPVGMGQ